jgi:hypothetical protein
MLDYIMNARWDQAYNFLLSGDPPMYIRLLAVNALFLLLFLIRKVAGARPMSDVSSLLTQFSLLAANIIVLFQSDIEVYLRGVMAGYWR